jgi:nicotinate-nucleotide pyrophosphorylase (carboxylating)
MQRLQIDELLRRALDEDLGAGDLTTDAVVPAEARAEAHLLAKEDGVVAGVPIFLRVFELLDVACQVDALCDDGTRVQSGQLVARVRGLARAILSGERTALNLVQRLSGVATAAAQAVSAVGSKTLILDTRKTTPGLRALEKYAVRIGGARNHRIGLYDAVMIKNNHLKFAAPAEAIRRARRSAPATATVEIEVETLEQLREALEERPDIILLDNMSNDLIREAVDLVAGRARLEVSGNVTTERLPQLAALGVDYVSMGALTHSARALDFSLRVSALPEGPVV